MFDVSVLIDALKPEVLAAMSSTAKQAVTDTYQGLKVMLSKKFGGDSEVAQALEKVEKNPGSPGRQEVLKEEWETAGADKDSDISQLLAKLKAALESGGHIIQGDGSFHGGTNSKFYGDVVVGGTKTEVHGDQYNIHGKKNDSNPK